MLGRTVKYGNVSDAVYQFGMRGLANAVDHCLLFFTTGCIQANLDELVMLDAGVYLVDDTVGDAGGAHDNHRFE